MLLLLGLGTAGWLGLRFVQNSGPEGTVNAFFESFQAKDRPKTIDLMCQPLRERFLKDSAIDTFFTGEINTWKVKDVSTSATTAQVTASLTGADTKGTTVSGDATFTLAKEDAGWRICSVDSDIFRIR